jgi:hypothetical protein
MQTRPSSWVSLFDLPSIFISSLWYRTFLTIVGLHTCRGTCSPSLFASVGGAVQKIGDRGRNSTTHPFPSVHIVAHTCYLSLTRSSKRALTLVQMLDHEAQDVRAAALDTLLLACSSDWMNLPVDSLQVIPLVHLPCVPADMAWWRRVEVVGTGSTRPRGHHTSESISESPPSTQQCSRSASRCECCFSAAVG